MSRLSVILDYVTAAQESLGLQMEGITLPVVQRKLPGVEETIDPPYQTLVSGAERVDQVRRIGFGSKWQVLYVVEITLVTPGDRDRAFNLVPHTDWREATRAFWMAPGSMAPADAKRVELNDSAFLDRSKLAQGYDYQQVVLQITTYESRP